MIINMCKINRILSSAGVETGKALPSYQSCQCLSVRLWASGYPRGICSSVTRSGNRLSVVGVACQESFLGGHKMMSGPYHYYYYLS